MTFLVIVVYLLIPNKSLPLKLFNIIKLLLSGPHRQLVCFPTAPCLFYDMFAIRLGLICRPSPELPLFWEALALCNGEDCGSSPFATINVAMILDTNYLRDTMLHHSILLLLGPHRRPVCFRTAPWLFISTP